MSNEPEAAALSQRKHSLFNNQNEVNIMYYGISLATLLK